MKKYYKPFIEEEKLELEDVIMASNGDDADYWLDSDESED